MHHILSSGPNPSAIHQKPCVPHRLQFLPTPPDVLSSLAVPQGLPSNDRDPSPLSLAVEGEGNTHSLKDAFATLNAKIALGHLGALGTLSALATAGVVGMLETTSLLTLSLLALSRAVSMRTKQTANEQSLDRVRNEVPSFFHIGSLMRTKAIVENLCTRSDIPEPYIVIDGSSSLNAAMLDRRRGRDVLLLTEGILYTLNDRELRAVIAHELAHQNRWYSRITDCTAIMATWIAPIATWGVGLVCFKALAATTGFLGGLALGLAAGVQATLAARQAMNLFSCYVSRHNEIKTDLRACEMTGDPEALISALSKLVASAPEYVEARNKLARWGLLTHPSLEERARAIRRVFGAPH